MERESLRRVLIPMTSPNEPAPGAEPAPPDAPAHHPARREGHGDAPPVPRDDQDLLAQCRVDTFRAGGPGGQHQNVTESAVRLTHLPTGVVVVARDERSQHRNRTRALARLRKALADLGRVEAPRIPTRVPPGEKRRRREAKSRRSQTKKMRRPPKGEP